MLVFLKAAFSSVLLLYFVSGLQAQTLAVSDPVTRFQREYVNDHLYKGRRYDAYGLITNGHQSFQEVGMVEGGSVLFDKIAYTDQFLMYDVVIDELIIRHPTKLQSIVLPKQLVDFFSIGSHQFVNVKDISSNLTPGYYHELYKNDDLTCYAKWSKEIKEYTRGTRVLREFGESVRFYFKKSDSEVFIPISNQAVLLNAFKEKKRELRRLIYSNNLSFKRYPEETLMLVLNHVYQ